MRTNQAASLSRRYLALGFLALAAAWPLLIVTIPFAAEAWPASRPLAGVTAAAYLVGSKVCHQQPERSFRAGGVRFPVCARCTGLYLAAPFGAIAACAARPRIGRRLSVAHVRRTVGVAAVPTAVTILLEWSGGAVSGEWRALAAFPLGAAIGWLIVIAIHGAEDPDAADRA
jgi:hypothetical protein